MNLTWLTPSNSNNKTLNIILFLTTENSTNINDNIISSKITKFILIFLMSFMTLITVSGNLLVIIAFIRESRIRTYSNYFILNLSIADLLVGLIW
jgi:hypothetical protein